VDEIAFLGISIDDGAILWDVILGWERDLLAELIKDYFV
jgi:hypothetical protein